MQSERIAVVGAGLMGHGIAQVFARAGFHTKITDPDAATRASIIDRIRANLSDLGQDSGAADLVEVLSDLRATVGDADLIVEAGPENLEIKRAIFRDIESSARADAVLASNTSVMPITAIMADLLTKARALGTHWWNPPFLAPLVEVVRTRETSDESVTRTIDLLRRAGKTPVEVKKDVPGFVGNRLQHALWREAIALVEQGVCDAETVDAVVKASFGRRLAVLGPLENADLVGTDLTLAIHETVLPAIDRRSEPSPYLRKLVEAGKLGFKTGEGFRTWSDEAKQELRKRVIDHLKSFDASKS
jgi:3-hydroxybutyryl-CoA dehydrogenase